MQKEDTGWSDDRTLDKPAHLTVIWFSTNRMTMPQGGTYPDPECFWDAAVLQFVAPAEMRERESAETRRHFKAEPGSDHSFSDHQPFKLIWIAKSSAITKQNLVRIITGLKSYNWLDGLLLSKREGNTNLVKSTFLKWKLPFPHLNQHQC